MSAAELMSGSGSAPTERTPSIGRRRGVVAGSVGLVILTAALPLVFLPMSEHVAGAHTTFHVLGILTCVAGVWLMHLLRRGASRTVSVMSWIVSVALAGWLVGHAGELVAVFAGGGIAHDSEVFAHAGHTFFANIAVPSWMLSVLSLVVLLLTVATQALTARVRAARSGR